MQVMRIIYRDSRMIVSGAVTLLALLCLTPEVMSGSMNGNAGNTSAQFLKITPGCRAAAMGDTAVVTGGSIESLFYNPAGLGALDYIEIMAGYSKWIEDMNYSSAAMGISLGQAGTAGIGFTGLFYGDIPVITKKSGGEWEERGNTMASDMCLQIGYGKTIGGILSAGIGAKMINQVLESENAKSYGMDIGCTVRLSGGRLGAGAAVQNIGTKAKFMRDSYELPRVIRAGLSYEAVKTEKQSALIGVEIKKASDENIIYSAGLEYAYSSVIYIRGGYRLGHDVSTYTAGGGVRVPYGKNFIKADYAYEPYGILGEIHRLGLVIGLSGK